VQFDTAVFAGRATPSREIGLSSTFTLFRYFRVFALIDYKGGHKLLNHTQTFMCTLAVVGGHCPQMYTEGSPLEHQARAIALTNAPVGMGTRYGYIEDGDFTRLREVSLALTAPRHLTGRVGILPRVALRADVSRKPVGVRQREHRTAHPPRQPRIRALHVRGWPAPSRGRSSSGASCCALWTVSTAPPPTRRPPNSPLDSSGSASNWHTRNRPRSPGSVTT
jgi:hypothetical protein